MSIFPDLKVYETVNLADYKQHFADCVVMTQNGALLLQYRPATWRRNPEWYTAFGGHVEAGEDIMTALQRELKEELGADVKVEDVAFLGVVTEAETDHTEAVHVHFWHDKDGTITGCYEAEARTFPHVYAALGMEKTMPYLRWALAVCKARGFLP
ncbi:MAG TPA: NUDIX hydrolase [Alphaproteobacteria bacterium]|nr:NUDIX hydrolase [Alphaproteobacteria bacterium]